MPVGTPVPVRDVPRRGRWRWLAAAGAAALVSACRLDSRYLYYPTRHDDAAWRAAAQRHGAEPVALPLADGVVLRGWFLRSPGGPQRQAAVLYFGGNAEDLRGILADAHRMGGRALLALSYRGYGASTGAPAERLLYADALAAYDWLAARPDVDPARIAVWGRSLGTGVATWVAAHRPVDAVVLTSPFDSIASLARHHQPLLAPLVTQRFDSRSRAPRIDAPLLALVGGADTVVPPEYSARLVADWRGPTRTVLVPGAEHNELQADPAYWRAVAAFLSVPPR